VRRFRISLRSLCLATTLILVSSCGGPSQPPTRGSRQSLFLLGVNSSFNPADLSLLSNLGNPSGGVRITFYWKMVEPLPGTWDFSFYDPLVAQAQTDGIPIIAILAYSVKWASPTDPSAQDPSAFSFYPPDVGDFTDYVSTLVSRYPSIHSWEVWNEPNGPSFWLPKPDVAQYSQLLRQTYATIKTLHPDDQVILGGLTPGFPGVTSGTTISPEDFLAGVYQNAGKDYFDVVGFHPYNPGTDPDKYLQTYVTNLYEVMAANNDASKKILVSELGWYAGTAPLAVSEDTQALYLTRAYNILYNLEFVGGYYWYHLKDHTSVPQPTDPELNYGLYRWDGTPRAAATSFRILAVP
jgi:polysaccharide biosynthesis protein PslG